MSILVDGKSASASEILAAALQDNGRAVVIGTTSYGKGSVQTVVRLPNDGEITLTWSRFLTPSGRELHKHGVSPSLCTSGMTDDSVLATLDTIADTPTCKRERRKGKLESAVAARIMRDPKLYERMLQRRMPQESAQEDKSARSTP